MSAQVDRHTPEGQVLWPVQPIPGESLLGWTVRTAHNNVLPSCYTLLRRAGRAYTDKPIIALLRTDEADALADVLGTDVEQVRRRMLHQCRTPGFVLLDGISVRASLLVTNRRRFAPAAMVGVATHRSIWMLRVLPFCADTWQYLRDDCADCGMVQKWRGAGDMSRCDRCGAHLSDIEGNDVEEINREPLARLAALAGEAWSDATAARAALPLNLRSMDGGDILELAFTIAALLHPELKNLLGARAGIKEHRGVADAMAQAWRLLVALPGSVLKVPPPNQNAYIWSKVSPRRLAATMQDGDRYAAPAGVRSALARLHEALFEGSDAHSVRVKAAARLLGQTEGEVAAARDDGTLATRRVVRGGRLLFNFDRSEIEAVAKVRRERLSPYALGAELGLPPYGAAQLLDEGIVEAADHAWIVRRYGAPQATRSALESFRCRMAAAAVGQCPEGSLVSLAAAMRGYGGGPKPWAIVVRGMLTGDIPFWVASGKVAIVNLLMRTDDARRCWDMPPAPVEPAYCQLDALDVLNMRPKHGRRLASLSLGDNPEKWIVKGIELAAAATERMSYPELLSRTGWSHSRATALRTLLVARGASPPTDFGWLRAEVMAMASDLCSQGPAGENPSSFRGVLAITHRSASVNATGMLGHASGRGGTAKQRQRCQ